MHHGILLVDIENGGHWPWPSRSSWPFWLGILVNLIVLVITWNGFELESPNLHQICILGFSHLILKMGVLDLQGQLAISTQETAFKVALVYWSRPAKGFYMSQTCSCYTLLYPPHNEVVGGVYWFHLVCPSVCPSIRPAFRVRCVAPTVLVGSISYLYILSSNFRRCVACKVYYKIWIFGNFLKFVTLTWSCFDFGSDMNP